MFSSNDFQRSDVLFMEKSCRETLVIRIHWNVLLLWRRYDLANNVFL